MSERYGGGRISSQLPFLTAPELVSTAARELSLSTAEIVAARRLAERYGGVNADRALPNTPPGVAAAAIWLAAEDVTQREVGEVLDVTPVTVRAAARKIESAGGLP